MQKRKNMTEFTYHDSLEDLLEAKKSLADLIDTSGDQWIDNQIEELLSQEI